MKINLKILAEELKRYQPEVFAETENQELNLKGAELWRKNTAYSPDICYVMRSQEVTEKYVCPENLTLVIIGEAEDEKWRQYSGRILVFHVPGRKEMFYECFNSILKVFRKYQEFEERLKQLLIENSSLQEVVRCAENFLKNPMIVFDRNYCVLNEVDGRIQDIHWFRDKWSGSKMLPLETVNIIKISPEYRKSRENTGTYFVSNEYFDYNMILSSYSRQGYFATIAVVEIYTPLSDIHKCLVKYLSEILYQVLNKNSAVSGHSVKFEHFLKELLYSRQIEQAVVDRYLMEFGWKNTDHYVCVAFKTNHWDKINLLYNNICMNIENRIPQSYAFFYENNIVTVINLDKANLSKQQIKEHLSVFLREGLFHMGISYIFFEFSTFTSYYEQTLGALEMGEKYSPFEWCYDFEDYVLHFFMHYGTSRIDGRHLCYPGVVQLYIYDRKNHTELLDTLRVYLEAGSNAAAAAQQLYIHRNTLYQRLRKIEEIIRVDLNDPQTRLFVLMSYTFVELLDLKPIEQE